MYAGIRSMTALQIVAREGLTGAVGELILSDRQSIFKQDINGT